MKTGVKARNWRESSSQSQEPRTLGKKNRATILVVEDHPLFLKVVTEILEAHFTVLSANGPVEGLLLSDVMMPGMNGPDLAKYLKKQRPSISIMLMSSFPDGAVLVLNYGWHFILKGFLPLALVARIKDVLKSKTVEQGTDHFDTRN
jgi:two-component system cell cycle sensor histidine kinase/response regulator CckA